MSDDPFLLNQREIEKANTPFADALKDLPKNELLVKGTISSDGGAGADVTLEREGANASGGIVAGINQKKGWGVAGFFKWMWK